MAVCPLCKQHHEPNVEHGHAADIGYYPIAAQSDAPSARTVQGSFGGTFYISPDGNFLIWDTKPPTEADDAHRGLLIALDKSEANVAQLERELKELRGEK